MIFSGKKIKIDNELYKQLTIGAENRGYSSTEEFIRHVLEQSVVELEELSDKEQAEQQLRGLGYLE